MMNREEREQILKESAPNSWIALSEDESRVVGRGSTYFEAIENARESGEEDPLLLKMPEAWNDLVLRCA